MSKHRLSVGNSGKIKFMSNLLKQKQNILSCMMHDVRCKTIADALIFEKKKKNMAGDCRQCQILSTKCNHSQNADHCALCIHTIRHTPYTSMSIAFCLHLYTRYKQMKPLYSVKMVTSTST